MSGRVEGIAVAAEATGPVRAVERVSARAGRGLEGEYHADVTLIEAEALEGLAADTGIALRHEDTWRNVLTRGIDLNALVGRRFRVGEALCEGVELAEPCRKLERRTEQGVLRGLVRRGGLRAAVLAAGTISVGDRVEPC